MSRIVSENIKTPDGHLLHYDLYSRGHDKLIIIAPGFFNSKGALLMKDLAEDIIDSYDALILDFRGHGQSKQLFTWTSREYLDLLTLFEFARSRRYRKIGLIGFSLGGASSLIAASKSDAVDSIVAVSAPAEFWKIEYFFWQLNLGLDIHYSLLSEGRIGKGVRPGPFWLPKEKPKDAVKKINRPIFYIHGTDDWLIKPWHSEVLFKETLHPVKKIEITLGAPHAEYMMKTHRGEFVKKIKDWFKETI